MTPLLEVRDLTFTYPRGPRALERLSLTMAPEEWVGLIGPDGAGKTTTFRLLMGLQRPTGGSLHIGIPRSSLGYVPQTFALPPDLTVLENLLLQARLFGLTPKRADLTSLLARVGLERFENRLAGALSGGMKQKLALCVALLPRPRLLMLDEPTTGVDPVSRREFWDLLHDIHAEGVAILFSTPYLDEAEYAHRMLFLHEGRCLMEGTLETFQRSLSGVFVVLTASRRRDLEPHVAALNPLDLFGEGDRLRVRFPEQPPDPLLERLRALPGVERVELTEPTLEDAFLHTLTARSGSHHD